MLAVLDPNLFHPERPVSGAVLDEVVYLLRQTGAVIPNKKFYWNRIAKDFLEPLSRNTKDHAYRARLDALRHHVHAVPLPEPPRRVVVWSFRTMFGNTLGTPWVDIMHKVVTGCVLTERPTILFTRLHEGNSRQHRHGDVCCIEKTCWNLRVQPEGAPATRIPCVCSRRNHHVPWTCRYDDNLPADTDGGSFPFRPHPEWQKSSVPVFRTHSARPAWLDAQGQAWAKPSTGGGYHWDVYLTRANEEEYGLGQLNITAWAAPRKEGQAGEIHHVPTGKDSKLRKRTGWG